jgi:hypothetical protein
MKIDITGRHVSTQHVAHYFAYEHLNAGPIREVAEMCSEFAGQMLLVLPDGPELTVGLRKLLEAKDAFVRCAVGQIVP